MARTAIKADHGRMDAKMGALALSLRMRKKKTLGGRRRAMSRAAVRYRVRWRGLTLPPCLPARAGARAAPWCVHTTSKANKPPRPGGAPWCPPSRRTNAGARAFVARNKDLDVFRGQSSCVIFSYF